MEVIVTPVTGLTLPTPWHIEYDGVIKKLTQKEMGVFRLLLDNLNQAVKRSTVWENIFPDKDGGLTTNEVDVYISYLRNKLRAIPNFPLKITTVRNVGYMMELIVQAS